MSVAILTDQKSADEAYRLWVDALLFSSDRLDYGWILKDWGVAFTNYGHGRTDQILDQVMLGYDKSSGNNIVKIKQPDVSLGDKGPKTILGQTSDGRVLLMREGRLQKNGLSDTVTKDFATFSGLKPETVTVDGQASKKSYFEVADLSKPPSDIAAQTAAFTIACANARNRAGGHIQIESEAIGHSYGQDEVGRVFTVIRQAETAEVIAMQGYVYEALKAILGNRLSKPAKSGFEVDGLIESANLLIEIKSGTCAKDIYTAIGQLMLYPSIIGLPDDVKPVLLVPAEPTLKPLLEKAVRARGVSIYSYSIEQEVMPPKITFDPEFLIRCQG